MTTREKKSGIYIERGREEVRTERASHICSASDNPHAQSLYNRITQIECTRPFLEGTDCQHSKKSSSRIEDSCVQLLSKNAPTCLSILHGPRWLSQGFQPSQRFFRLLEPCRPINLNGILLVERVTRVWNSGISIAFLRGSKTFVL